MMLDKAATLDKTTATLARSTTPPHPPVRERPARRVCMIVMSRYPNDERVRREACALARAGIAVDVICQRAEGESAREQFGLVTAWRVMRQSDKESVGRYLWVSARFMLAAVLKLHQLSLRRRYHAIQAHNMPDFLIFAGLFHRLLRGTPLVLDLHELSVELFRSKWQGAKSRRLMPLVELVEKASCTLASRLITTSEGFRARLAQRGVPRGKVELVLNAPDPRHFQFQEDRAFTPIDRDLRLLYHGTVAERFGLATAIDAVALLRERFPGVHLAIHGKYDPSYRQELERKIEALHLGGHVTLGGWLTVDRIAPTIRQAEIGLVPYLKDEFMSLALSTKTFEYATTGLPVVASRLDSITTYFDERAVEFFEPGDAADLAARVAALAADPARRQAHVQTARGILDGISGHVMEQRYVNLMKGVMGINGNGNGAAH
jgi:glycosyltransferase involved in cell wall biosynthesis